MLTSPKCHTIDEDGADMQQWFDELNRLVSEAAERFARGEVLPTLASLAALPQVHMTIVEHCRRTLDNATLADDDADAATGLYL